VKRRQDNNEAAMTQEELMKYKDLKLIFILKNRDRTFEYSEWQLLLEYSEEYKAIEHKP